jgi:hypothetical protein
MISDAAFRAHKVNYTPLLTLSDGQVSQEMVGVPVEGGLNVVNDGQNYDTTTNLCANNGTCINSGSFIFR